MKFKVENIAEYLHKRLNEHFREGSAGVRISKEGAGVHWNCNVEWKERKCKIHCFEHRHYEDVKSEYLTSFEESNTNVAWGRTYDIEETIESSEAWVANHEIAFLHEKFAFIDYYKRRIREIEKQIIQNEPALLELEKEMTCQWGSDLYDYAILHKNRSCELDGFGGKSPISFVFKWDDCKLFWLENDDLALIAEVIKKWLIDEITPSVLESQHDGIEIGQLAMYYEQGQGVVGEFIVSWKGREKFYRELSDDRHLFKEDALKLIEEMKDKGLDRELRVGGSLFSFILSRSRKHCLRDNHSYLCLTFLGQNRMEIQANWQGEIEEVESEVKLAGIFEALVKRLLKENIE